MPATATTPSLPVPQPPPPAPVRLLVIGYGNALFRDDGVGPYVAGRVAAWGREGVAALARQQLAPEIAAALAEAELAVFVDAAAGPFGHPRLTPLAPAPDNAALGHAVTPAALLALTQAAFGRCPPAWMLTVPAADFSLGERLSPVAREGADRALCQLRHLSRAFAGEP